MKANAIHMECESLGTGNKHSAACFFSNVKDDWRHGIGDGAFTSVYVSLSSELFPRSTCNTAVVIVANSSACVWASPRFVVWLPDCDQEPCVDGMGLFGRWHSLGLAF